MAIVKTAAVGEIEMRYAVCGTGPKAFVVLPGISVAYVTDSAAEVESVFADFYEAYTVYLFDRRERVPEGYTIREMAEDTFRVMQAIGIEKADVFGASQGGMMALYLAADYPDFVRHLAVGSAAAEITDAFRKIYQNWICLAKAGDSRGLTKDFAELLYGAKTRKEFGEAILSAAPVYPRPLLERFARLAEAFGTFCVSGALTKISCPMIAIGSRGDRVFGENATSELARKFGCESYQYGPDYGHAVYDEAPTYYKRILAFFRDQKFEEENTNSNE